MTGAAVGALEVPTWTSLGQRIRDLRHERGWSQAELALRIGVHAESISRWELGKETPHLGSLARIALAIDVDDLGELLAGVKTRDVLR